MNTNDGFQYTTGFPTSVDFGLHSILRISSLVDGSLFYGHHFCVPGNIAIDAFSCISKFASALVLWLSTGAGSNYKQSGNFKHRSGRSCKRVKDVTSCTQDLAKLNIRVTKNFRSSRSVPSMALSIRDLFKEFGPLHSHPVLQLAAAFVPPIDNLSSKVLLETSHESINRLINQAPSVDDCQGCRSFSLSPICWTRDRVEPMTGIVFPTFLGNGVAGDHFHQSTEVLVGTGARSMKIVKFKSLKLYAFGFSCISPLPMVLIMIMQSSFILDVQPDSICEQLGSKYASVPTSDLKDRSEFFEDLLRADIHMTVRLVVNCNGIKIAAVKDAFEKSLRARLDKMNPDADHHCLSTFGSYFTQDIPLPLGTAIVFRKTADGKLVTEIGGKHIGAVQSKDLCRAFFDMYIGESPVSAKAKQEVAENVADLIRRCQ